MPYVLPFDEQNIVYEASYEYYFANGLLKKVKSGANTIAEYIYDAVGNRVRIDFGNGTYTTYSYDSDPRYRVNSIAHYRAGTPAVELATISYATRDAVGNPESIVDWVGTWLYGYDANNRLDWALVPDVLGGPAARVVPGQPAGGDYVYDWVGNRLRPPYGTGNEMVYNKADQLVRWPGMHTYAYDGAGNLTQVKNDSETQVVKSYTYTPTGLLDTAIFKDKSGNTRTLSNTWDADSNRVSFNANGTEYEVVYDPTAGIPGVIEESSGGISVYYIREPGEELIARLHPTEGIRYYHFDELGSTRLLTDGSGNVTDRYAYDAYGFLLSHDRFEGSVNQPYQYVGQLGYYTHWIEPDFELLQLGVRFYDPEVGRFTQHGSPYTFADSNPVSIRGVGSVIIKLPGIKGNPNEIDADIAQLGYMTTYCVFKARNKAIQMVQGQYGPKRPWNDSWENAIMHCTLTCVIAGECGRNAAVVATNNHEKYNWNPTTGPMDLANNKEGLNCFDWAPPLCPGRKRNYTKTCFDCCRKRVYSGHWWGPAKKPVPVYPGGNS